MQGKDAKYSRDIQQSNKKKQTEWHQVMEEENQSLEDKKTCILANTHENKGLTANRWTFKGFDNIC